MGPAGLVGTEGFLNSSCPPCSVWETDLLSAGVELEPGWDTSRELERSEVKPPGAPELPSVPSSPGSSDIVSRGKPSRSRLEVLDLTLGVGDGVGPVPQPLNQLSRTLSSVAVLGSPS